MDKNVISTFLAMLYLIINIVASLNNTTEEYALLAFRSQITFDPNKILAKNWRHQRVRSLNLADMGVGGTIAKEIGDSFLRSFIISNNNFHGFIPNEIDIGLRNNSLSGSLPMDICYNLPKLERLRIAVNQISGNIPSSLGTCLNLEQLSLSYNHFSGRIPIEIGNLSKLQMLYLEANSLIETGLNS
ncbi:putative receptor-like protein kinase At3g47110 [Olea europaea var. sylvestris]|uniref:putative receptor-like protein kinase At3g47110 n=1 Tax=Olea europaea var. sylvestris TaxID=158386 RepID=UPI000C1CFE93|nr:putative receptor-like protein kinase At3g47110 [Olea europaea var. sylvestris]